VSAKPAVLPASAVGVYLPEGRHPIIPFFQHSIIPINCERSEPKFYFSSDNRHLDLSLTINWLGTNIHLDPGSVQSSAQSRAEKNKNSSTLLTKTF
jgi:hypothetical protein